MMVNGDLLGLRVENGRGTVSTKTKCLCGGKHEISPFGNNTSYIICFTAVCKTILSTFS